MLQVDAVIVNCTSFNPVPSLSAAVINHFRMKSTTLGYSLSGMGCSASIIAIDLAQELLQVSLHDCTQAWATSPWQG